MDWIDDIDRLRRHGYEEYPGQGAICHISPVADPEFPGGERQPIITVRNVVAAR